MLFFWGPEIKIFREPKKFHFLAIWGPEKLLFWRPGKAIFTEAEKMASSRPEIAIFRGPKKILF